MKKLINRCPVCGERLQVAVLRCPGCSLELRNDFELSPLEALEGEMYDFLMEFLRCRGNLKSMGEKTGMSYPALRRRLEELLSALGLQEEAEPELPELESWVTHPESCLASEIIKTKLKAAGGRALCPTLSGVPCSIQVSGDGESFISDKLPISPPFRFTVFDTVTELLLRSGGRARKGNGRSFKLGQPNCDSSTVVGYVAEHYSGKKKGDSVFDPVFVLAAVLEWAGIAHNGRGELSLTAEYKEKLC